MRSETPTRESPVVEIQIHPASVRWGVRVLHLDRRRLHIVLVVSTLLTALVVTGLAALPWSVAGLVRARQYRALLAERELQGDRAQALSLELDALRAETGELSQRMARIFLTYGLTIDEAAGEDRSLAAPRPPLDSIYASVVGSGRRLERQVARDLSLLGAFLEEIEVFEQAHREQVRTTPSISPLLPESFVLTSPYGRRHSPFTKKIDAHPGLDMAAPAGTPILAPAEGVVVFAGRYPARQSVAWWRFGNLVALRHGKQFITLFGHCEEILVRTGQKVEQGETIATVGDSGWSTSPHLHYEVRVRMDDGEFVPVDPRVYILDHRWRDQEQVLIQARSAPTLSGYEPLPRLIGR